MTLLIMAAATTAKSIDSAPAAVSSYAGDAIFAKVRDISFVRLFSSYFMNKMRHRVHFE